MKVSVNGKKQKVESAPGSYFTLAARMARRRQGENSIADAVAHRVFARHDATKSPCFTARLCWPANWARTPCRIPSRATRPITAAARAGRAGVCRRRRKVAEARQAGLRQAVDVSHPWHRPAERCDVDSVLSNAPPALFGLIGNCFPSGGLGAAQAEFARRGSQAHAPRGAHGGRLPARRTAVREVITTSMATKAIPAISRAGNCATLGRRLVLVPDEGGRRRDEQLLCIWWGDETGQRKFDILVDSVKIASQKLVHNRPGQFWDATYPHSQRTHARQNQSDREIAGAARQFRRRAIRLPCPALQTKIKYYVTTIHHRIWTTARTRFAPSSSTSPTARKSATAVWTTRTARRA